MALNYDSPLIDNTTGSPTLDSLKSGSDKINGALTEIKEEVSTLVPKSGGTFTGDIAAPKITASTGILFGTDTAAANTLDDYEEGTWTPTLLHGGTVTTTLQPLYTKVGNTVTVTGYVSFSGVPDDNDTFQIAGLPFNTTDTYQAGSIGFVGSANLPDLLLVLNNNSDYFYFHISSGITSSIKNSDVVAAGLTQMAFSCTYITNS